MISFISQIEPFEAYADSVGMPESERDKPFLAWLAAKRHAAQNEPTNEQRHEAACAALLASAELIPAQVAETAPRAKVYVTCIDKGGKYRHLGVAMPAGAMRGREDLDVYGDTQTGALYYRSRSDFRERMMPMHVPAQPGIEPAPSGASVDSVARDAARAKRLLAAAKTYADNHLIDQFNDPRDCVDSDTQHAEVRELFASIAAMSPTKAGEA